MAKLRSMLDTNICIYLVNEASESVVNRFAQCEVGEVSLSAVTWAELCCGIVALVTNNTADFLVYQPAGLRLENWT